MASGEIRLSTTTMRRMPVLAQSQSPGQSGQPIDMSPSADGIAPIVVTAQSQVAGPPSLFQAGLSFFYAPSGTQFQALYLAGRNLAAKGGSLSQLGQLIGRGGTYNFQLDSQAQWGEYDFYQDAANFAVGVVSAGYFSNAPILGWITMSEAGQAYALPSTNWSAAQAYSWEQWWTAGYVAGMSGNFPVEIGPPLQMGGPSR
jgi:hypothetical protein